jgi:hypothetical protein
MNSNVDLYWDWKEIEETEHGFPLGPDDRTRASFGIQFGRDWITKNTLADTADTETHNTVTGSLSGLADWFVENWVDLHWEIYTPFEKAPAGVESDGLVFPSIREADERWPSFTDSSDSSSENKAIANWQHRHIVGHATSDIALPSIAIVPEFQHVIVEVEGLPDSFRSTLEFVPPDEEQFPARFVFRKTEFFSAFGQLVRAVIDRAEEFDKTEHWAEWLSERWEAAKMAEKDPKERLRAMLEPAWADAVFDLQESNSRVAEGMQSLLIDCELPEKPNGEFNELSEIVRDTVSDSGNGAGWKDIRYSVSERVPPYTQGYDLATYLRKVLDLGAEPIQNLQKLLEKLDLEVETPIDTELFRTAFCADTSGKGKILRSSTKPRMRGIAGSRFAIAAALGRLLFAKSQDANEVFCGGHGSHSRWLETKRANAFAIEFLMPKDGIAEKVGERATDTEISHLADDYGVSREAAKWHAYNRGFAEAPE